MKDCEYVPRTSPSPVGTLLERVVAIARDAAIGGLDFAPMLIALPDDNVPQVLFLEIDDDARSRAVLAGQIDAFVHGAGVWLMIARGELQTPGLPPETDLVNCSAHEGDDEQTVLLRLVRDEEGRIHDLVEVLPPALPWLGLPAHSC